MMQGPTTQQRQPFRLGGLRVLVVEDEYYIADDLRRHLTEAGAVVIGPMPDLDHAAAAVASEDFDCAVIDVNLHGENGATIADQLAERGIPFVIATGYGSGAIPLRHQAAPRCEKPFDPDQIVSLLSQWTSARVD